MTPRPRPERRLNGRRRDPGFCRSGRLLFLIGLGYGWLGAVGGLFRQSHRAQVSHPLSYGDVGSRDIRHGLDTFGILGELSFQPDLFELGGGFRFVIHRMPQDSQGAHRRACASNPTMHWIDKVASLSLSGIRRECAVFVQNWRLWLRVADRRATGSSRSHGNLPSVSDQNVAPAFTM